MHLFLEPEYDARKSRIKHARHTLCIAYEVQDISFYSLRIKVIPVGSFINSKMILSVCPGVTD